MTEYLVRWKFGPNSLLNHLSTETLWYQQFHSTKKSAVDHYTSLLLNSSPSMAMTAEIFQITQLIPGQEEPKEPMSVEELLETVPPKKDNTKRNNKIVKMHTDGYTNTEIAKAVGVSYSTVYGVLRKL
ncbi:MAG: helix-turn-helix domain-containing protein [Paenisporosarcina sp.]